MVSPSEVSLLPEGPDEISARIRAKLPTLAPAAAKVARLILDQPDTVTKSTVLDVKGITGVSEATVVRTVRSLGFAGYPQLRLALAAASGRRPTAHVVTGDVSEDDPTEIVITKLAGSEQQAVRETAARLDPVALDGVTDAIARSSRVLCFGIGASGLVAADLQQKLSRAGFICHSPTDNHLALTDAALLGHSDVIMVVSHSGETPEAVSVLEVARRAGAVTVALTGSDRSALAQRATFSLIAAGHEQGLRPGALSSRIGQLFVVDCLFVSLTQKTFEETNASIVLTRETTARWRAARSVRDFPIADP